MNVDRRSRVRRESDRNLLEQFKHLKQQDARETGLIIGAFLLSALAVLIFG